MKEEVFAEAGFGNENFFSTEVEVGKREYRIKGFKIPKKITGAYLRIWIKNKVFILSTVNGFEIVIKSKKNFKILFGIRGFYLR